MDPITLMVLFAVGGALCATVAWAAIRGWLSSHRTATAHAVLLKERLAGGNYKVIANVFDGGRQVATNSWEASQLDAELESKFGGSPVAYVHTL